MHLAAGVHYILCIKVLAKDMKIQHLKHYRVWQIVVLPSYYARRNMLKKTMFKQFWPVLSSDVFGTTVSKMYYTQAYIR